MLADASISHAGVSKEKLQRTARPAIGAHARRPVAAQGGGKRRLRRGIPVGLAGWYGPGSGLRGDNARGGGAGVGWHWRRSRERATSRGGDAHRGGTVCQGPTVRGEGRTSTQSSWLVAGDRDAPVSGRGVASGRSNVLERGHSSGMGASGTGVTRRGGDDDRGREARQRFGGND
jgi:hypothetical protein